MREFFVPALLVVFVLATMGLVKFTDLVIPTLVVFGIMGLIHWLITREDSEGSFNYDD
jgi:hypothetical protein